MRVLFLQDNAINESLALTELSAYLRAHWVTGSLEGAAGSVAVTRTGRSGT
jgi:hypothetical protein